MRRAKRIKNVRSVLPPKAAPVVPTCKLCGAVCTVDELCHGCKKYVCISCDRDPAGVPWGPHDVTMHDPEFRRAYDEG